MAAAGKRPPVVDLTSEDRPSRRQRGSAGGGVIVIHDGQGGGGRCAPWPEVLVLSDGEGYDGGGRGGRGGSWPEVLVLSDGEGDGGGAMGASGAGPSGGSAGGGPRLARPAGAITCPICMAVAEVEEGVELDACGHAFCEDCISTYVRGKVGDGDILPGALSCPRVDPARCGVPIAPRDVEALLGSLAARARYQRLSLLRSVDVAEDMGRCPAPDCEYIFVWAPDQDREFNCPACRATFCLACGCGPWHAGKRCEEYQAEKGDEGAAEKCFAAYASSKHLRQCPKCRAMVEKTSGCDAMHCRCDVVFCYVCCGVLPRSKYAREGMKVCACGERVWGLLRAHDGAANHNLVR